MVATKIFHELQGSHEATLASIEDLSTDITIAEYDSLVIGFPTIHAAPAYPYLPFYNLWIIFGKHVKDIRKTVREEKHDYDSK